MSSKEKKVNASARDMVTSFQSLVSEISSEMIDDVGKL